MMIMIIKMIQLEAACCLKESLAIEKYIVLNMQDPDQYFLGILVRFPN